MDEGTAEWSLYTIISSADVLFMMWSCALEYSDIIHSQIMLDSNKQITSPLTSIAFNIFK